MRGALWEVIGSTVFVVGLFVLTVFLWVAMP